MKKNLSYLIDGKISTYQVFQPYDPVLCDFSDTLSKTLRSLKETKKYPDILTFAFWCRRANIKRLKRNFNSSEKRLGLGLIFHITPSNVPVNFAYSFIFGLLSGNANVVRVPSTEYKQTEIIVSAIKKVLKDNKFKEIKNMNSFIKYEKDDEITSYFSSFCDGRIIWGGDQTVLSVRKIPVPVKAIEISFPDRYSFCLINLKSFSQLDKANVKKLAQNFYNDTFLMDQNACSSPHLVIWLGNMKHPEELKSLFWSVLEKIVRQQYELPAIKVVDKYSKLLSDVMSAKDVETKFKNYGNFIYRMKLNSIPVHIDELKGKYGFFYEAQIKSMEHMTNFINSKYQTLTYLGFQKEELEDFVIKNRLSGIDRIVPVGQALDIDIIWDGYDLAKSLSRIIDVR